MTSDARHNHEPVWMAVTEDVAAGYERDALGDPVLVGVLVYRPTTEKVRNLKLRELDRLGAQWDPAQVLSVSDRPPSPDQLAAAWANGRSSAAMASASAIEAGMSDTLRSVEDEIAQATAPGELLRREGEDPTEFYRRVGRAHRALSRATKRPTSELARRCAVPVGTAAAWVNRARARGVYGQGEEQP